MVYILIHKNNLMSSVQVSKLDNDPASASVGPTRGALPRPAAAATPFRAFKRADINASELTREDLEAAGQDPGAAYGDLLAPMQSSPH